MTTVQQATFGKRNVVVEDTSGEARTVPGNANSANVSPELMAELSGLLGQSDSLDEGRQRRYGGSGNQTSSYGCGSGKSLGTLVVLWAFLGGFGMHRFYLGHFAHGTAMIVMLVVAWLTFGSSALGLAAASAGAPSIGSAIGLLIGGSIWIVYAIWIFIDVLYVIVRKVSSSP